MRHLIINAKNYPEASGDKMARLAKSAFEVATESGVRNRVSMILAVPAFSILQIARAYPKVKIYAQHLDDVSVGSTTGFLVPEIAKSFGASGSLLNHSEHRLQEEQIKSLVARLRILKMTSVVCARDAEEVARLARLEPDFIAIEPPELIGSGNAVSRARPELITDSKAAIKRASSKARAPALLCGAGIIDQSDARKAVELGAEGILVASGVIKSKDWYSAIRSLAEGLIGAKGRQR